MGTHIREKNIGRKLSEQLNTSLSSWRHLSHTSGRHSSHTSGRHLSHTSGRHLSHTSGRHLSHTSGRHLSRTSQLASPRVPEFPLRPGIFVQLFSDWGRRKSRFFYSRRYADTWLSWLESRVWRCGTCVHACGQCVALALLSIVDVYILLAHCLYNCLIFIFCS